MITERDPRFDPRPGDRVRTKRGAMLVVEDGSTWGPGAVKFYNERKPDTITIFLDRALWIKRVWQGTVLTTTEGR